MNDNKTPTTSYISPCLLYVPLYRHMYAVSHLCWSVELSSLTSLTGSQLKNYSLHWWSVEMFPTAIVVSGKGLVDS